MRITNLSKAGIFFGIVLFLVSIWKWFLNDWSQFIFGCGFSCCIILFAYLYSWMKDKDEQITELEESSGKRYDNLYKLIEKLQK